MAQQSISQQVLEDFMATIAKNPNVDRQQLLKAFPEFNNDMKTLDAAFDYRATRLENPTLDIPTVNAKFPEFFGTQEPEQQQPQNPRVKDFPAPTTEAEYQANLQRQWADEQPIAQQATPQGRELKMEEIVRPKGYENLTDEQLEEQMKQLSGNVHEQKARELYKNRYGKDYVEPEEPTGWWDKYGYGQKGMQYRAEKQRYAEAVLDASRIAELDDPGAAKRRNEQLATLKQEKAWRDRQEAMPKLGEEIKELQQRVLSNEKQDGIDMKGAKHLLNQTIDLYNAPSKYGTGNGFVNWGKGLADQITDYDTWTAGVTELVRMGNLNSIVNKMNKGGYDSLTKEEQLVLETFLMSTAVQDMRQDISQGYEIGKGAAESIPFMVEMYLTAGAGAAAKRGLVQLAERKVGQAFAEKLARSLGGTVIRDAAGKMVERGATQTVAGKVGKTLAYDFAQTAVMPSTYANIYKDRVTEILQGDGDYNFTDLARTFTGQMVETGTERWGGRLIDRGIGKFIPIDATSLWGKNKLFGHFVENYINSPIGETGEEVIAAGVNTLRSLNPLYYNVDDKSVSSNQRLRGELGEMLSPEGLGKTFLTILPISIFGGAANATMNRIAAHQVMRNYGQTRQDIQNLLIENGAMPEEAGRIVSQLEASDSDRAFFDKMNIIYSQLLNKHLMENPNESEEDAKRFQADLNGRLGQYMKQAGEYNQMVGDLMEKYEKLPEDEKRNVDAAMEDFMVRAAEDFATRQQAAEQMQQLSPEEQERQRIADEVTQEIGQNTHGNGYLYPVSDPSNAERTGFIVGEVVPVIDETNPQKPTIQNNDVVTVKWSDGTVTQTAAKDLDLAGAPSLATDAINAEVEARMQQAQTIETSEQLYKVGDEVTITQDGQTYTSRVVSVTDEGVEVEIENPITGQPDTTIIPHELAQQILQPASSGQSGDLQRDEAPITTGTNGMQPPGVPEQQAPVEPDFDSMSAADYAGAAVEYMGSREYVDEYLDGEIKKAQQQLDVANRKKVGNVTDMADFKSKKDAIEAEKKALQARLDKLTEAKEKAKSYLTIAEREQRAQAEAERRAAEEAARIAREQAAAAEAARLEQERIDREIKKGVPDFSEDNDRDARARGFHVVNGQVIRRQTPLTPKAVGKPVMVQFAKGKNGEAEAVNVLININELQPSHINGQRNPAFFVSEMQPKDRRDQVSKVTAQEAAQNIHPGEIIGGTTAYVGSPVVLSTGEVVQGNWRGNVLIEMYRNYPESVAKYKQALIDNAASLNLTEQDIERIKNEDVISVRMLKDLPIEQAIQLGQKKATDLETGGVQLIDPQVTATQLGDKIERFANTLLKSDDEEASLADLTLRNSKPALDFLQSLNIISPAQMQSAFDSRGNMTAETKAALQGVLKQVLFKDAKNDNLPIMFDDIPLTAQKAILQTIVRDIKTKDPDAKLTPHIQEAIGALYRALHQSTEVKNSRNEQETRAAMHSWAIQMQFPSDFDAENFVPSEIFSNFALELATLFKYGKQTEVSKKLNAYYDAVQGTTGGLFGDTPAIPYKEAIKQIFGIDYKSVDEVLREKHRKELTDYLNTIADEAHPFELYGNDNVIEILKGLGANDVILARAQELIDSGESILGIKGNGGRLLLNSDSLADKEAARSKYVHERQHLLTTPEQKERVLKAASVDELKLIVKIFTNGSDFYDRAGEDEIADEFISYSMEEAYAVESDEELESILRAAGANDELINIIKSINNEQRENDERLGQSERLGNARRHTDVDTDSEGHREQGGRDQGTESGVLEPKGARLNTRGELGGRTGGENQGSTEGAGLPEVGTKEASGEAAGESGTPKPNANNDQEGAGVGEKRGLGEVKSAAETEIGGALVDRLGDMGLNVSTDLAANRQALKAAKADKSEAGAIHYYKTPSGQQYGFAYKGKVYLDPTKIDAELPIHEYGHLWTEALRRLNPENWQRVVETIKADKEAWAFVRELRPELTDENEIAEEVIATFSGKNGAEKMRAEYERMHGKDADYKSKWGNIFKNISKAIQDFWKAVGDFLNIKYESAEQVYDQVLKDFVDNMNPWKRVSDYLQARDKEYVQAAESGDIKTATNLFYDALKENIGNGITPYMSVGTYTQLKRLAKGVKTRNEGVIKEAAAKIAPLIPDNAVLIPAPSHDGRATDMLDLAKAVAEITGSEVADVLRSAPRESQYQAKKATGVPMASKQLGIAVEGEIPADKTPIIIDNVVDSGNTAEACVQAVGKGVVVTLADSAEQYRHAASLKSAAPVLRDKAGKVIPLSKRFEPKGSRYLGRRIYLSSNDPRFAISGTQVIPVTDKTLVGLHNISAEKLRKALKMGGLANPSTAVIDIARQNHEQYGDISLIMPSRLVDSDTGRNAGTFTGDIWSPTYPHVEKQMSDKGDDAYYAAITKAFGNNEARRPILSRAKLDFDDYLDSGNIRAGLAYWYLLEKGIEPGDVYFNSGISDDIKECFRPLYDKGILDLTKEDYRTLLSLIAEQQGKTAEDMLQDAQESKARYQQTIDDPEAKQFYKKIAQQAIDEIDLYGVLYNVLSNGYHAMERAIRNDGKIDLDSTLIAAQDIVQTQYQADFDKWISDMDERFDISEVLFEDYDRDGNRKYKPHTLANVSRMMNKEDLQNAGDHGGLGATRGILVKRLETLADIRAEKGRLRPGTEEDIETEEWNKMQDEWFNKVLNPLSDMQKISDNPFSNVGYAETRLQEALRTKDPIAHLNKEYGYHIAKDSQWAKDLADMVERVKNLPTKYFETKFRRPVYLNEFANAVVPNDLPQDLRAGLESAGLRLFSYDPNAQGSRRDATLEATAGEGIRFSISSAKGSPSVARRGNLQYSEGVLPSVAKEMESIKNNAINNGTFMQAPNGKPTNLDERQWLQVRTRAFQRMFGDWINDNENATKVLDENGEPMVAKHGTPFTFTTFDKSKQQQNDAGWLGRGFYFFTKNDDYAAGYARGGQVINAFLNIKNPYYATYADMERLAEMDSKEESERFTQGLIDEGYDGVYFDANLNGEWVAFDPNQIKSATNNNGDFSDENDDIRFSISNQNNDIFYSNAERAVEGIKQEKATPEQWRAMIEKAGGLKAGEDKWIGLSDWLAQQRPTVELQPNETRSQYIVRLGEASKKFTISKQDILDYIREHKIQIEEVPYAEGLSTDAEQKLDEFNAEFEELIFEGDEETGSIYTSDWVDYAWRAMVDRYGDDFESAFEIEGEGTGSRLTPTMDYYGNYSDVALYFLGEGESRPINGTRLQYTTEGLQNKREIALVVPTIESWNQGDEIHFGDAGEGRAVAWVRFGDTHKIKEDWTDGEGNLHEGAEALEDVLVIDEIQSKRHQEGREKGYKASPTEEETKEIIRREKVANSLRGDKYDFEREMKVKYGSFDFEDIFKSQMTEAERDEWRQYDHDVDEAEAELHELKDRFPYDPSTPPVAPFEKNWHELAMKRILRFAAENGYDKVAWTTGEQQAKRYDIGKEIDHIVKTDENTYEVYPTSGLMMTLEFDENGMYADEYDREYNGKSMSDIFGKDLAKRLKEMPVDETLQGDGLRVGYDGMKGFYDDMLPRFMQKYGKKWGVQVGEVTMPQLEDGYQTMHAIDINDAMRESVMEGQPMFSISGRGVNGTIKPQEGETRSQYIARVADTVKNMTPRNTTIDEAIRFSITVNHNSPYLLKRADGAFVDPETGERLGFDHRFIGKGEGGQAHGWGSYFSVRDLKGYAEGDSPAFHSSYMGFGADYWTDKALDLEQDAYYDNYENEEVNEQERKAKIIANILRGIDNGDSFDTAANRVLNYYAGKTREEYRKTFESLDKSHFHLPPEHIRHHYDVEIPDNDGTNYLEEERYYTVSETEEIAKRISLAEGRQWGAGDLEGRNSDNVKFATGEDIYRSVVRHLRKTEWDRLSRSEILTNNPAEEASKLLNKAGFVGIHYFGFRDGECYVIFDENDAKITNHIRFSVTGGANEQQPIGVSYQNPRGKAPQTPTGNGIQPPVDDFDDQIRFSVVTSRKKIAELEAGEKIKVYRAAQVIDGKLYPPMAAKQQGQLVKPIELGRWEQAEEHPELAKDGKFKLDKANGSSVVPAAYNPYFHTSRSPLNDQFSSAYDRPNLVTLEVEVPASELTSGYKAEGAKDAVGETSWHSGAVSGKLAKAGEPRKVILSRWDKPLRIVPDAEVAEKIAEMLAGKDIAIPYNVVTPSLRAELEKQGVTISDQPSGTVKKPKEEIRFSVTNNDLDKYKQVATDAWNKYQYDGELESIRDVAEYIEDNMPKDKATAALFDAIDKWSAEEAEDRMLYGERGDLEPFEDAILNEIELLMKPKEDIRFSVSNPSTLSRSEIVTKALVQQANNNYNIMQSALKKVTADLKGIRAAMRMQSDYDRKVVDALLNLYNTLLQENGVWAQYMPDTTRRIATQIVHAIGKQNITEEVNTIMDHMVHAQAKAAQRQWDKLRQTPIDKINISGVVMQGKVALEGQHALKAMNDALQANMTIEQIEEQINQLMDMEDNATDESLKTQYKGQWIGLTIAAQHLERLQHLQEERQQLELELQSARSNKALKPAARQQLVDNIKQAMRDNYIEQAEAYTRSTQDLSEYVNTQEGRAKDFIRRQDANRDKIRSYAQRDLEGLATNPNRNRTRGNVARSIWDAFASPIRDLQSLLRLTGLHAPDGEGYLYNHFMRNWMDGADMERTGIVAASKTLDEKIAELTHGKYKTWEEAARKINDASHNMFGITMLNGVDGKDMPVTEEIPLNAGNALYIYAVNKMNDGRMKLNGMNITEEDVKALADKVREQFGQEILDVVDWVQSEFFSQLRNRYNPTHEALFGAPMDAIENYFPLRINANARQQNEDLSEPDTDAARLLAGTSTGAIKRRTRNSLPLDVRNADFFQEVIRHISQMERWNAFAQWNRDANILFSDINFRNRIKGMKGTIYGEGDKLYNYMKDAFRVAIGTYKPKTDTFSEITLNMAKGVTSAKINFRVFTALKQIASFPAFFTYMQDGVFVGSYLCNWLKPHETMKWAKENLPNFEKRVSKRDMGDMRLMQRSTDWQWNKRILEWSSKYGMFFNVFFDTLTCATGARAVYDSHLADYLKKGYSEEDARNRARQDAEQAFNTSQQSSEGAFMSAVQQDRNLVTAALTVFRTSPIQYTRNFFYHTRNLLRKFGEGKRDEQIAFRMGQYKNDGLNDEQARKAAEKDYNKSLRQDIVGFVVYGALLNILWRLAGQIPYLLLGDDDDKKKQILDDATSGGAWFSPFTGLLGGGIVESALDGNGSVADMFAPEMPFAQDIKRAGQYLSNDKYAEFASQALSVLMQSGTGFDPLTASDMVSRIVTTLDSEEELDAATQALRVSQALLSIPQSQYEQMLIDKVVSGETDEDAALEDYIRYQKIHTAPLTWFMRGEESDEKAEENAEKRFNKLLTERDKLHNPEDYEE